MSAARPQTVEAGTRHTADFLAHALAIYRAYRLDLQELRRGDA